MGQMQCRPLGPSGLGLCHTQDARNGDERCQAEEGFGAGSRERALALEETRLQKNWVYARERYQHPEEGDQGQQT